MLRVGLTGGLGSGKTTVARRLAERGAAVFDADAIVSELYAPGAAGARAVEELFGSNALDPAGGVDRTRVAAIVFADGERRRALEKRIHPLVRREIERRFADAAGRGARVAVAEASQLLEARTDSQYDRVLLVVAPEAERLRRWTTDGGSVEDARRRIAAQISAEAATPRAHDVLVNDGTIEELRGKVDELWKKWIGE